MCWICWISVGSHPSSQIHPLRLLQHCYNVILLCFHSHARLVHVLRSQVIIFTPTLIPNPRNPQEALCKTYSSIDVRLPKHPLNHISQTLQCPSQMKCALFEFSTDIGGGSGMVTNHHCVFNVRRRIVARFPVASDRE